MVRQHATARFANYAKNAVYEPCPNDKQEPFWVNHWEILAEHSCSCRFSDFVSAFWTLFSTCWSSKNDSLLSIRDWFLCAFFIIWGFASDVLGSGVHVSLDELFQEKERGREEEPPGEVSEVESVIVRWVRVVGRLKDDNDVQLELGATLFDSNSKAFSGKSPEPPPAKIEARGLRYTLPTSHLEWACITPAWSGRIPKPSFPEGGSKLSELQKRRLKHNQVPKVKSFERPAILDYLEIFRWPQGQGPASSGS